MARSLGARIIQGHALSCRHGRKHLFLARLRNLRPRAAARPAGAVCRSAHRSLDLVEIGEPVNWHCQPAPDFLPDPESVLLTGILPQHALQHGLPEHAFAAAIERELARDGTIGVGYNSIRFDDEVTRHLFWRCLIDPYAREWQNGCGRWDLMDVVRCTWALRPGGIQWPTYTEGELAGRPSFRLEHLTAANGLGHEAAHDALSDVRATIALARLIRQQQPRLWDFCLKLRKKDAVAAEMGVGPALRAPVRPLPGGTRLPGHRLAAGAAPHQQERGHRLGSGAGPARTGQPRRRYGAAPHVHAAG
jgi:exonuclease I